MHISTSTNILFERSDGSRIDAAECIRRCAAAGYKEMDFCFVDQIFNPNRTPFVGDKWKTYIEEFVRLSEKLNIKFTQSHLPIHDFCNSRMNDNETWQLVCRSIEASSILGVKWAVIHPSTKVTDEKISPDTKQMNIDYMRRVADYAGKFSLGIAVENMWGETKEGVKRYAISPEELCELIDSVGYENVGACWDTEHGSIESLNQAEAIRMVGDRMKATHISDEAGRNSIHILPYMGFCNWDDVLKAFADIGYKNAFTYEIQHYLLRMPMELVDESIRYSHMVGTHMIQVMEQYI